MILGYSFALLSSIFFTCYVVPKKISKQNNNKSKRLGRGNTKNC